MALLDESNLLAERARHAKFRTNHVGTKLNEAELHELGELVAKRKEIPAELILGLVLRELKRDKEGLKPSVRDGGNNGLTVANHQPAEARPHWNQDDPGLLRWHRERSKTPQARTGVGGT